VSPSPLDLHRPTWAEVDLDALAANLAAVKRRVGQVPILAVVKADAYGHGAATVARRLEHEGIEWLGVALPEEGVALRESGVRAPILVLGGFVAAQADLVLANDLTTALFRRRYPNVELRLRETASDRVEPAGAAVEAGLVQDLQAFFRPFSWEDHRDPFWDRL